MEVEGTGRLDQEALVVRFVLLVHDGEVYHPRVNQRGVVTQTVARYPRAADRNDCVGNGPIRAPIDHPPAHAIERSLDGLVLPGRRAFTWAEAAHRGERCQGND